MVLSTRSVSNILLFCFTAPVQMLAALQLCGASLDDYLHLLVPPIVKVFETPTNPTDVRK